MTAADLEQAAPPVPEQAVRAVMRLTLRRGCPVGRETAEEIVATVLACALASPGQGTV